MTKTEFPGYDSWKLAHDPALDHEREPAKTCKECKHCVAHVNTYWPLYTCALVDELGDGESNIEPDSEACGDFEPKEEAPDEAP